MKTKTMTDLQIISLLSKNLKISEVRFIADGGEADDKDRLMVTCSTGSYVLIYEDIIITLSIGNNPLKLEKTCNNLIAQIVRYLNNW